MGQKRDAPVELGRVLIKPPSAATGAGTSAFGGESGHRMVLLAVSANDP
jgi:hypothetical protein